MDLVRPRIYWRNGLGLFVYPRHWLYSMTEVTVLVATFNSAIDA